MSTPLLTQVLARVEAAPHSAASLTLYALMLTLEREAAGCLFRLTKLRDLDPEGRRLAYALMERMACGDLLDDEWRTTMRRIEALIRDG